MSIKEPVSRHEKVSSTALLRLVWLDYLGIFSFVLFTLGIWKMPIYYFDDRIVPMSPWVSEPSLDYGLASLRPPIELDYPWRPEPIPSWACGVIVVLVPLIIVALFQLKSPGLYDLHAGVSGVLKAVVATAFVCTVLKQVVGGFRPHFMDACKPDPNSITKEPGLERYWLGVIACTGDPYEIKKALQSFPSGHAANSFASGSFTILYLNAKLKTFSDHGSHFWIMMVTISPLLVASLVSGSMYTSYQHHANDIVFGMVIGLSFGILAYRSVYTSVFDFRRNHIPLMLPSRPIESSATAPIQQDMSAKEVEERSVLSCDTFSWTRWGQQRFHFRSTNIPLSKKNENGAEVEPICVPPVVN
ncbi:hypothetical protein HYALB_00006657 [Hymenoscyphus albidus]|uniref:Phosphatidic acid phosphatase type 2/haloperoxidase domain-containing protein n=1 Tax=Hymenoscyphus albidus TaxID=595503 RepID=A0A9N9QCT4_9HELO|nr:hypothetical protein HYALB_00006657 [Hymenoscyphus albidus]